MKHNKILLLIIIISLLGCTKNGPSDTTTDTNGKYSIWAKTDLGYGNINVYIDNLLVGTISHYYPNGITCGSSDVNITKPAGTYAFAAQGQGGGSWNGTIQFDAGQCKTSELTGGGSSSGGGGSSCNWTSMSNYIQVISTAMGTRCGVSRSFNVTYKNTSDFKLITVICFQQNDGTYKSLSDYGVNPGETTNLYSCDYPNGMYKIFAMKFSESGGCTHSPCY